MSQELYYTSAPQGLELGATGFTTVAATRALNPRLREKLQAHSTYRHLFPPLDPRNPVVFSHLKLAAGGAPSHVLSRISDAPLDYTGRGNYFAHHVILEPNELPRAGPVWLLLQPNFLESRWQGEPRWLESGRRVPGGDLAPIPCLHWGQWAGDPGWAGVLLQEFDRDPNRPVAVLTPPNFEALPLLSEALALLPAERRWEVTFSTLYLGVQPGTMCAWRFLPRALADSERPGWLSGAFVLDLTRPLGRAPDGPYADAARAGRAIRRAAPAPAPAPAAVGTGPMNRPVDLPARDAGRRNIPDPYPTPVGLARPPRPEQMAVTNAHADTTPEAPPVNEPSLLPETHVPREKPVGRFPFITLAVGLILGLLIAGGGAMAYWQLGGLKDELEQLRRDKPELEGKLEKLGQDKKLIDDAHSQLSGAHNQLVAKHKIVEGEKTGLEEKVKNLSGTSTDHQKKIGLLTDEVAALKKQKDELDRQLSTARAEVARVGGSKEGLTKELRESLSFHKGFADTLITAINEPNEANFKQLRAMVPELLLNVGDRELLAYHDYFKKRNIDATIVQVVGLVEDYEKAEKVRPRLPNLTLMWTQMHTAYTACNEKCQAFIKEYPGTYTAREVERKRTALWMKIKKFEKRPD